MATIDQMFELAENLRDSNDLSNAAGVLTKIIHDYPADERLYKAYLLLGGVYRLWGDYDRSIANFIKSTELNPASEVASMGLFMIYFKLGQVKDAHSEMIRYLNQNEGDMYKDILTGLFEQIQKSDVPESDFKREVIRLAKVRGIS